MKQKTKEKLTKLKTEGEKQNKKWSEMPKEFVKINDYIICYCIENFQRIASVSKIDKKDFCIQDFYKDVPGFLEIFGNPIVSVDDCFPLRGKTKLLYFNGINHPFQPANFSV